MFLYKNIPTGIIPETPNTNTLNIGSKTELAKHQEEIVKRYAPLVSYKEECNGSMFQDIVPIKSLSSLQTSTSSETPLEIHTEQAFSDERPTFLSLACLRGDPNAVTYILTLEEILKHLTDEEVSLLKKPMWMCGVDLSFVLGGEEDSLRGPMSVLSEDASEIVFDQDLMVGLEPDAKHMIRRIIEIWDEHKTGVTLESGDVLVIDNRIALHGRSKFSPRYDGTDRFLIRCFARIKVLHAEYDFGRTVKTLSFDEIEFGEGHPYKSAWFDLHDGLLKHIEENGLKNPIADVNKCGKYYFSGIGQARAQCAIKMGYTHIDCIILNNDDEVLPLLIEQAKTGKDNYTTEPGNCWWENQHNCNTI